jgi:FMN phosphatase YigB (HAD superfamily)
MFDAMLATAARFDIAPHEILHVAESLYHDHVPAKGLGLATAWIHRRHGRPGSGATAPTTTPVQPDYYASSLQELVPGSCESISACEPIADAVR